METQLAMLSVKERLGLLLQDQKALGSPRQKWIDVKIAEKLGYPVFISTSERASAAGYVVLAVVGVPGSGNHTSLFGTGVLNS